MVLTHCFGPKMAIFPNYFFRQYRPENFILRYFKTQKGHSRLQKQEIQRVKKSHFSRSVNPWFWSKNGHFFKLFFFDNIGQKSYFYYILKRKNAFLGYKKKKFKSQKIDIFQKVFNSWLWSKNGRFSNFFFR